MRNARRFLAVAIVLGAVAALALPAFAAESATVGSFVRQLAVAKGLNANDARTAMDSLAARGVRLPADLDLSAPLTERVVEKIARAAGINVTTSNPDAAFSQDQVNRFLQSFGSELALNPGRGAGFTTNDDSEDGPPFDPKSKGKGKGKKKGQETPTEPE
ncbi:MAG TPA: hypothetical protein VJS92_02630 [Candidatus Polarisedimenticolaceae bacterium]|nr:hypothetical protein [Candidatus Polarisedimenticolaceae bacterium]